MALTATELQARKSRVGASEVASILGMPTFAGRNAYTVWLDKTDQLEPEAKPATWLNAGNRFEPLVLDYAEEQHGQLERNVVVFDPEGGPIASTLDGRVIADGRPVEAKTSGIVGPIHGSWGEPGSDDVPDGYQVQCQTQLLCTGADVCHLVALLGSRGFVEYQIEPHDGLAKVIRDASIDFFERYVQPNRDPRSDWADRLHNVHGIELMSDPCAPSLEMVKRFRRIPDKTVAVNPSLVTAWQEAAKAATEAKKAADQAQADLRAAIGDAGAGVLDDGSYVERCIERGQWSYDREAMAAAGILEQYAQQGTRQVLRLRKAKK